MKPLETRKIARSFAARRGGKITTTGGYFGAMQAWVDIEACVCVPVGSGRRTGARESEPGAPRAREGTVRELHEE